MAGEGGNGTGARFIPCCRPPRRRRRAARSALQALEGHGKPVARSPRHMKATMVMKKTQDGAEAGGDSPSGLIDGRIRELGDWRGEMLARVRALIRQADPEVVEEWKWRGVPV